jgi:hypothetical protein
VVANCDHQKYGAGAPNPGEVAERLEASQSVRSSRVTHSGHSRLGLAGVVHRLMDPENSSVTLRTIYRAASVLGKRIALQLMDAA